MRRFLILVLFPLFLLPQAVSAQSGKGCAAMDRPCLIKSLEQIAPSITNADERDHVYRNIARSLTYEGNPDKALAMASSITGNHHKFALLGDIGRASADAGFTPTRQRALFLKLLDTAKNIKNDKAQAAAYAEIGVAQAYAGDISGAQSTFGNLSKGVQKEKALAEAAAMRAQKGDANGAISLIAAIGTQSYRNKAYDVLANLFLEKAQISEAYACASSIDNGYLKATAIQRILDKGNADKIARQPDEDLLKALDIAP